MTLKKRLNNTRKVSYGDIEPPFEFPVKGEVRFEVDNKSLEVISMKVCSANGFGNWHKQEIAYDHNVRSPYYFIIENGGSKIISSNGFKYDSTKHEWQPEA